MSDYYQGTDGIEYREGYNNGRADARAELMPEIEGLRREIDALDAEIERLRAELDRERQELARLRGLPRLAQLDAEIERLRAQCEGLAQSALNNGQDLLLKEREIERLRVLLEAISRIVGRQGSEAHSLAEDVRRALENKSERPERSNADVVLGPDPLEDHMRDSSRNDIVERLQECLKII